MAAGDPVEQPEPTERQEEQQTVEPPAEVTGTPQESAEEAYLRGRNDAIREVMNRPGLYEPPVERHNRDMNLKDDLTADFLTRIRPSAWD